MHEKGRVNGLVGKQVGKQTELEGNASNRPKTQVESMLWEKCAGFFIKKGKSGRFVLAWLNMLGFVVMVLTYLGPLILGRT